MLAHLARFRSVRILLALLGGLPLVISQSAAAQTGLPPRPDAGPPKLFVPDAPVLDPHPSVTNASAVAISGTAAAAVSVEVSAPLEDFAATFPVSQGVFNALVPLSLNKVNPIVFRAVSFVGTKSSPTITTVAWDSEPPVIQITFPADGTTSTVDPISASGEVFDLFGGGPALTVSVNGSPAQLQVVQGGLTSFLAPAVDLNDTGAPTPIVVVAIDAAGNQANAAINVSFLPPPAGSTTITVSSGNGQVGIVEQELAQPIVVQIKKPDGTPFVGKLATFEVVESNGLLSETSGGPGSQLLQVLADDPDGFATAWWTLGSDAGVGNNRVAASSKDAFGTTVFIASAQPDVASQVSINSGSEQVAETGALAPLPLRARVTDGQNGVSGVVVTFSVIAGGGLVSGSSSTQVTSDAQGYAQVAFRLGPQPGINSIEADFTGGLGLPAEFSLIGIERVPGQPTSLSGLVTDDANHPLEGVTCRVKVGNSVSASTTSDAQGRFMFATLAVSGAVTLELDGGDASSVEGTPVPPGSYSELPVQLLLVPEAQNQLPAPVALPSLDPLNAVLFDNTQTVKLTISGLEGLEFTVHAGSLSGVPLPAPLSLNLLSVEQLPFVLPDGGAPPLAWVLEPFGAKFDPPIDFTLPNLAGLAAHRKVYVWGFDPIGGSLGVVSGGGVSGVTTTVGPGSGLPNAGIGFMVPPFSQHSTISTPDICQATAGDICQTASGDIPTTALLPVVGGTIRADACGSGAFGMPHGSEDNPGVDIEGPLGAAVIAVYDGVVVAVQTGCVPDVSCSVASQGCGSGYGNFVVLAHSVSAPSLSTFYTAYAQLDAVFVDVGDTVLASDVLGTLGQTGNANPACFTCAIAPYLHFELSAIAPPLSADAPRCDPSVFLCSLPPPGGGGPPAPDFGDFTGQTDFEAGGQAGFPTATTLATVVGVPAPAGGQTALHATWTVGNTTRELQSPFLATLPGGVHTVSQLDLDPDGPPVELSITSPTTILTTQGQTAQLAVTATDEAGGVRDVTLQSKGTTFTTSDAGVVAVGRNGLISAMGAGTAIVSARNTGVVDALQVVVNLTDPLTEVQGFVFLQDGSAADASINIYPGNISGTTDPTTGFFLIEDVPSLQGNLVIFADAEVAGQKLSSTVTGIVPLPSEITDAGVIVLESTVYWDENASGDWNDGSKWNTDVVPQPGQNVVIDRPAGTFTITLAGAAANVKSLRCNETLVVQSSLQVTKPYQVNGQFTVQNGTLLQSTLLPGIGGTGVTLMDGTMGTMMVHAPIGVSSTDAALQVTTLLKGCVLTIENGGNVLATPDLTLAEATVQLGGGGPNSLAVGTNQSLQGTGTIESLSSTNSIFSDDAGMLTIEQGITIEGRGIVGNTSSSLVNHGTIRAEVTGQSLTVNGTNWINAPTGSLEVVNGGILRLHGSWTNQAGGLIQGGSNGTLVLGTAASLWTNLGTICTSTCIVDMNGNFMLDDQGSYCGATSTTRIFGTLDLQGTDTLTLDANTGTWTLFGGGTVKSGTIASADGQYLSVSNGKLDGIQIVGSGPVQLPDAASLRVLNGLVLNGTLPMSSTSFAGTFLNFDGTQTLSGTGTITMGGTNSGNFVWPVGSSTLTIGPGITIEGMGMVGATGNAFINQGTIRASVATQNLVLTGAGWSNTGTLETLSGCSLLLNGTYSSGGTMLLSGGTIGGSNPVTVETFPNGILTGSGTISTNLSNGGTIRPGGSAAAGTITVQGTYTQTSGGVLEIELGGTTAGSQYDQLIVTSTATLAETLSVSLIDAFSPIPGNSFDLLTRSSGSGMFAPENLPPVGNWQVTYPTTKVLITLN